MSDKMQRTAQSLRENMFNRYGDHKITGLRHKHNKYHLNYRQHWRSHPACTALLRNNSVQSREINESTGHIREKNLKKTRLRIVKHRVH